jgi:hypothetical protein
MLNIPRPAIWRTAGQIGMAAAAGPELKAFIRSLTERAEGLKKSVPISGGEDHAREA